MAESIRPKGKFIDAIGVWDSTIGVTQQRIDSSLESCNWDKSTGVFNTITSFVDFWKLHEKNMHPVTFISFGRGKLQFTLDGIAINGWFRWQVSSQNISGNSYNYNVDGIVTFYGNGAKIYRFFVNGSNVNALTVTCISRVEGNSTGIVNRSGTAYNAKYKSGTITYIVRNGICYVSLNAVYFTDQTSGRVDHSVSGFPKVLNNFVSYASMAGGVLTGEIFAYGGATALTFRTMGTGSLYGTMSYIVDYG